MALERTLASRPTFLGVGKRQCLSSMVPKHPYSQTASPAFVNQTKVSFLHPHLEFPGGRRCHHHPCPMAPSIKHLMVTKQGEPRKWRVVSLAAFPCWYLCSLLEVISMCKCFLPIASACVLFPLRCVAREAPWSRKTTDTTAH